MAYRPHVTASAFSLPSPKPHLGKDKDFKSGVNFAVAGATALPSNTLLKFNIPQVYTDSTLDVQLSWFETYLKSICSNKADCTQKLQNSIFIVGDIGSNDYMYGRLRRSYHIDVNALTPLITKAIADGVQYHPASRSVRVVRICRVEFLKRRRSCVRVLLSINGFGGPT
ncbi:hypothetical protein Syun_025015 [Stephania yunnanensis]|uniref:Uncharacterized protein n=1 Tax=Stephania yunnanensis TaxID=152371 RepID=A0AAP0ETF5_9MAGN